jgi:cell pole-organizing protein PopZ
MSSSNPQHEPTMEEILASIRKIISEDLPENAQAAPEPQGRAPAEAEHPIPPMDDVLELTEEVQEEETVAAFAVPPRAPVENDIAFETIDTHPKAEEPDAMEPDDLISDSTRYAVGRAFAPLEGGGSDQSAPSGVVDAIFVRAVQDAFTPTLHDWVDGHQTEIMERMKPLIRAWMDENLPSLIEAAVSKEIGRASAARFRKR